MDFGENGTRLLKKNWFSKLTKGRVSYVLYSIFCLPYKQKCVVYDNSQYSLDNPVNVVNIKDVILKFKNSKR